MAPTDSSGQGPVTRMVLVGDDELSAAVAEYAANWDAAVTRLLAPTADALKDALTDEVDVVVVVSHDDIRALRYALLVEHARPGIRLLVTLFDKTVASEVVRSVPNCTVIGMTDALVPALLGPCIADHLVALCRAGDGGYVGVNRSAAGLLAEPLPTVGVNPWRQAWDWIYAQVRPIEGNSRALLVGLLGLLSVFVLDTVLGALVLGQPVIASAWHSAMVLTTVDGGGSSGHGPAWLLLLSTFTLLCVLGFTALFTAGLIDRVTSVRFTGIVGGRAVPRRGHVIVVGLGQVGVRLCLELQRLGIGVVAVERDHTAAAVPLAKSLGIPVMFGRGGDRFLLRKLALPKARAIVAVSSNVLENIAVAVAARAVAPEQRIVLRAGGDEDVTTESQSLFRIGTACDVNHVGGSYIAATALNLSPRATFTLDHRTHVLHQDGTVHATDECRLTHQAGCLAQRQEQPADTAELITVSATGGRTR